MKKILFLVFITVISIFSCGLDINLSPLETPVNSSDGQNAHIRAGFETAIFMGNDILIVTNRLETSTLQAYKLTNSEPLRIAVLPRASSYVINYTDCLFFLTISRINGSVTNTCLIEMERPVFDFDYKSVLTNGILGLSVSNDIFAAAQTGNYEVEIMGICSNAVVYGINTLSVY